MTTQRKRQTADSFDGKLEAYRLLEPGEEEQYDNLVLLARRICDTPVAWLSVLYRDRECFESQIGLDNAELSGKTGFTDFLFETEDLMMVPDLTREERFLYLPWVRSSPGFRFFLGYPLFSREGYPLGSLAVADYRPRELSADTVDSFRKLGEQLAIQLENRRSTQELQNALIKERETEQALRETEEMYHDIFDNIMEGIYLSTPDGYYLSVNRMLARIYGYDSPEELIAAINDIKTQLYVDPNRRADFLREMNECGSVAKFESQVYRKDGSVIWISENARTVRDSNGNVLYFEGTVDDITDRRRAEEGLRNSEALYHSLVESLPQHIFRKDLEGRFTFANKRFCETLGKDLDEIVGKTDFDFFPADLARKYQEDDRLLLESGSTFETTEDHVGPNQQPMTVHVVKTLLRDGQGKVIGIQGIFWDVTQHKRMEQTLQRERDLHQALMDSSPDSIYFKDLRSRFIKCSKALATRLGLDDPQAAVSKTDYDFYPAEKAREYFEEEQQIIRTGNPVINKIERQLDPVGNESWASVTKFPIYNQADGITGIVGLSRDISQLKQTEAELEKARDIALESARVKSEFLANVSHEIRTPMNAIIGMTGLLLDTQLNEEQEEFAKTISDSAEALLTLVNDILDFSKMEAGKLTIEQIHFNLRELVEGTVEIFAERAQSKDLELACWLHHDVPISLQGDPGRLRQILINLLANALKFTQQGEVIVQISKKSETNDGVVIQFAIEDTGIGISSETMPWLFQAFTQADGSMARQYGGTGLGLAIVKQLVDMMNGRIDLTSTPNQGSTFFIEIPLTKQEGAEAAQKTIPVPPSLAGQGEQRILIIDDNEKMRTILCDYLQFAGITVETTGNADTALATMRQAAGAERPYHFALVDLDLESPNVDGLTLSVQIKADPNIAQTRLILLTPVGYHLTPEELEIGLAAIIPKPIKQQRLMTALQRASSGEHPLSSQKATRTGASAHPPSDLRILVAEDNEVNKTVALRQLDKLGFEADTAGNGVEVLERMKEKPYDVIFMDCQMPEMDGYKATRQIRNLEKQASASERRRPPYIIAMTANVLTGDREKCLASGMNDYLSKPIRQHDLASVLQRAGLNVGISIPPDRSEKPSRPAQPAVETEEQHEEPSPTLDQSVIDSLKELTQEGDANPVSEMAGLFYQDADKRIETLENAGAHQDSDSLIAAAHALKGSARNLGACRLAELCASVEQKAGQGQVKEAGELLNPLKQEYEAVQEALQTAENDAKSNTD